LKKYLAELLEISTNEFDAMTDISLTVNNFDENQSFSKQNRMLNVYI
jgi:hypothetical protein